MTQKTSVYARHIYLQYAKYNNMVQEDKEVRTKTVVKTYPTLEHHLSARLNSPYKPVLQATKNKNYTHVYKQAGRGSSCLHPCTLIGDFRAGRSQGHIGKCKRNPNNFHSSMLPFRGQQQIGQDCMLFLEKNTSQYIP